MRVRAFEVCALEDGRKVALLKKVESRCEPYIVAIGYEDNGKADGRTWERGIYFRTIWDAAEKYKEYARRSR